jgi:hypothetical protein
MEVLSMRNQVTRKWSVLTLACALLLFLPGALAQAKPAIPSITITAPGSSGAKVATADDYATQVLNDSWDMNELTDVSKPFQSIGSFSVANGIWTATTNGNQPFFWLLSPGYNGSLHIGRDGNNYMQNLKIDTSKYYNLSFRMNYTKTGVTSTRLVFYWTTGDLLFKTDASQAYAASNAMTILSGWHTYSVDLRTLGTNPSDRRNMTTWEGQITGLAFFFVDDTGGSTIQLDWVRLTGAAPTTTNYTIKWTATESNDMSVALLADDDANSGNGVISTIASSVAATAGAYTWGTTTRLFPGAYYISARMGMDYASLVLGDSWDMSESTDLASYTNIGNPSFSNGVFSGVVSSAGSSYLDLNVDPNHPLDPSVFKILTFRMNIGLSTSAYSVWWTDENDTAKGINIGGLRSGWNTYSYDLSKSPDWNNGQKKKIIRFYPTLSSGASFQLDWMTISTVANANNDFNALSAVYTAYSAAPLAINQPTRLAFTAPSYTSGEDYATATRGAAWDMNSVADVYTTPPPAEASIDLTNFSFTNGIANFQNTSDNSKLYLRGPETVPINSQKYRYFTYRFYIEGTQDLSSVGGWVGRVIWFGPLGYSNAGLGYVGDEAVTQDWPLLEGWTIYNIDLATAPLETERTNHSTWTSVQEHALRLTPNEGTLQQAMHLDYVRLTARDVADQSHTIRWNTVNPDSDTVAVTLYYDTDKDPSNGRTRIAALTNNPGSYVWNTSGLNNGAVLYISGDANDGTNTTTWYSEAPLVVSRAPTISVSEPNGANDSIVRGNEYATSVRNDAWDMSQSTDLSGYGGISGATFSKGIFSGQTNAIGASYLDLTVPSSNPIDPTIYQNLVFRMYSGNQVPGGYSIWWHDQNGSWCSWNPGYTMAGWNTYSLNLVSQGDWNNGRKKDFLRIYPAINAGNTFQLDWVKLLQPNSTTYTIQWAATNVSGANVSLYYDTVGSGYNGTLIVSGLSGTTTSYAWDASSLDLGTYYIYGKIDNNINPAAFSYGAGPLTIVSQSNPVLSVSPSALTFMAQTGTNPTDKTLLVDNAGTSSFSWNITSDSWITVTPNSGRQQPATSKVSVQASDKAVGTYTGQIVINAGSAGTATVPVTLIVVGQLYNLNLPLILK